MLKNKAYKFRIYTNKEQAITINKTIGCTRFVYNHFLREWSDMYQETGKGLNYNTCSSRLTDLKRQESTIWLKEPDKFALQNSLRDLADGFDRFFKKQNSHPRFKTKSHPKQSYQTQFTNGNIAVEGDKVKLPKLGWVKFAKSREVVGRILNATIRRNPTGKYFVSILCEVDIQPIPKANSTVGVDVGLKDLAILSDETVYENPKFFRSLEKKLAKEQKVLSRRMEQAKKDGKKLLHARNYQKQKRKVARIHEHITNKRNDYLHKISTEIVKNHDIIGIEDLQVSKMLQNKYYSKGISEVSWSQFRTLLEYKADWYGKEVVAVAKNFPSSQLCHCCGYQNKAVKSLAVREWECSKCQTHHDRDLNASINLKNEALRILASRTVGTTGIA